MESRHDEISIISSQDITSVQARDIDSAIEQMIQSSASNYVQMEQLTLDCSAALSNVQAHAGELAEQSAFKRLWNSVTGKNSQLRSVIDRDQAVATYALQQVLNRVLEESLRNTELSLRIKSKLDNEIYRLDSLGNERDMQINKIRGALVHVYRDFSDRVESIQNDQRRLTQHLGQRCEECNESLYDDQVVCPRCGTLQGLKMDKLPKPVRDRLKQLSDIVRRDEKDWNPDIYWDATARKYANALSRARAIAGKTGLLDKYGLLSKDMDELFDRCRRSEFQIAVVGIVKDGKSTLLNALIGLPVASTGVNSETAALTKFRSSSSGNYIKVSFYSREQWEELCRDAKNGDEKSNPDSLWKRINTSEAKQLAAQYIDHETLELPCHTIDALKVEVQKWTSASSVLHVFAFEVEIRLDKSLFQMPPEVVFVDTPGLKDPVKYRSKITEQYIDSADAVLIATSLAEGFTVDKFETVTRVLDRTGKDKVYIVGTKKDMQASERALEEKLYGRGGLTKTLSCRYKNESEVRDYLIPTSAALYIALKEFLEGKELSEEENNVLNGSIGAKWKWKHSPKDVRDDPKLAEELRQACGIDMLKNRLKNDLISRARDIKLEKIRISYQQCRNDLWNIVSRVSQNRWANLEQAEGNAEQLEKKYVEAKQRNESAWQRKQDIERQIDSLQKYIAYKLNEIESKSIQEASKQLSKHV